MLGLFLIVKMAVFHQHLPHRVAGVDKLAVKLHKHGLPLGSVVRLDLLHVALQLAAVALHVVDATDLGGARAHQNIPRPQIMGQAGKDVVVQIVILFADERHRADLYHCVKVKMRHGLLPLDISKTLQ